jgi:hypothetical protein
VEGASGYPVVDFIFRGGSFHRGLRYLLPSTSRIADVIVLTAGTAVWFIVAGGALYLTG